MNDFERDELKITTNVLVKVRGILLPLVDTKDNECEDMLACTVTNWNCIECLAKRIAKQYKELKYKNHVLKKDYEKKSKRERFRIFKRK